MSQPDNQPGKRDDKSDNRSSSTNDSTEGGERDWVERLAGLAGALGFNEVRVRWRLQRYKNERERKRQAADNRAQRLTWDHKICPDKQCGAINDRADKVCSRCGARLGSSAMQKLRRLGIIPEGVSASSVLGIAMMIVYARLIMVAGGGIVDMDGETLILHGANFRELVPSQPWRLLTALFLHSGLWHLGFNLYALTVVGPYVENVYSRTSVVVAFLLTGIAGSVASLAVGAGFSVGASGAIMGLIGVVVGESQRSGTEAALARRNAMLRWVVIITLFGLFVGNVDHAGHFGGLIAGGLLGYFISPRMVARAPEAVSKGLLGVVTAALVATLAAAIVPAGERHSTLCAFSINRPDQCPKLIELCTTVRAEGVEASDVPPNVRELCDAIDLPLPR